MLPKKDEPPRDFGRFLAALADGACASELSAELQRIVGLTCDEAEARMEDATGKLKLTLIIKASPSGHANVGYEIAVTEPKKERPLSLRFITPGHNLSDEMTRQQTLPLREAPRPREAAVEAPDTTTAREV